MDYHHNSNNTWADTCYRRKYGEGNARSMNSWSTAPRSRMNSLITRRCDSYHEPDNNIHDRLRNTNRDRDSRGDKKYVPDINLKKRKTRKAGQKSKLVSKVSSSENSSNSAVNISLSIRPSTVLKLMAGDTPLSINALEKSKKVTFADPVDTDENKDEVIQTNISEEKTDNTKLLSTKRITQIHIEPKMNDTECLLKPSSRDKPHRNKNMCPEYEYTISNNKGTTKTIVRRVQTKTKNPENKGQEIFDRNSTLFYRMEHTDIEEYENKDSSTERTHKNNKIIFDKKKKSRRQEMKNKSVNIRVKDKVNNLRKVTTVEYEPDIEKSSHPQKSDNTGRRQIVFEAHHSIKENGAKPTKDDKRNILDSSCTSLDENYYLSQFNQTMKEEWNLINKITGKNIS